MTARPRRGRGERGNATELVIIAPVLILFLFFIVGVGRLVSARAAVDGAARDAARQASIRRDAGSATATADQVAGLALATHNVRCRSRNVNVTYQAGVAVTVDVDCTVDNGDAVMAGLPGSSVLRGHFVAPIDVYRGS